MRIHLKMLNSVNLEAINMSHSKLVKLWAMFRLTFLSSSAGQSKLYNDIVGIRKRNQQPAEKRKNFVA